MLSDILYLLGCAPAACPTHTSNCYTLPPAGATNIVYGENLNYRHGIYNESRGSSPARYRTVSPCEPEPICLKIIDGEVREVDRKGEQPGQRWQTARLGKGADTLTKGG